MFQCSHMTAREAEVLQATLRRLGTDRVRQFWSVTQTNTDDWHCRITEPTHEEIHALTVLIRSAYDNAEGSVWGTGAVPEEGALDI